MCVNCDFIRSFSSVIHHFFLRETYVFSKKGKKVSPPFFPCTRFLFSLCLFSFRIFSERIFTVTTETFIARNLYFAFARLLCRLAQSLLSLRLAQTELRLLWLRLLLHRLCIAGRAAAAPAARGKMLSDTRRQSCRLYSVLIRRHARWSFFTG